MYLLTLSRTSLLVPVEGSRLRFVQRVRGKKPQEQRLGLQMDAVDSEGTAWMMLGKKLDKISYQS
jgi:hypothetical protein